jgi:predicted transcriptional regulator
MDYGQLFTAAKWEILENLSKRSMSPLELSTKVSTSMANISQSLRLLEMAGIVKSKRVPNRDKGQPRIVYSIVKDVVFPLVISKGFAAKDLIDLEPHRKALVRAWYFPIKKYQAPIEKFLWEIEPQFNEAEKISLVEYNDKKLTFHVLPTALAKKIGVKGVRAKGNNYAISIVADEGENPYVLHAPKLGSTQIRR